MDIRDNRLWLGGCDTEALAGEFGTPLYVYEEAVIRAQCRLFRQSFAATAPEIHFALKANHNPALLAILLEEGVGIDAVSPLEVRLGLEVGFPPEKIIFTGNNTSAAEMAYCLEQGVQVNVGSLEELERYGFLNPGGRVALRINPDVGAGHHDHVITGGPKSKFGIHHNETPAIEALLARHRLHLIGIHSHIGTGIMKPEQMLKAMEIILRTAEPFQDLEFVDFGGGFGIPYHPGEEPLNLPGLGAAMGERFAEFRRARGRELTMKLEPGRFLVAQSGSLLARVTAISSNPSYTFAGTDTGFNHLIRPALYGAFHEIVNASRMEGETRPIVVAGNICETGDVFTQGAEGMEARPLTVPQTGDLLAILNVGAYGMALASNYNLRERPAEILATDGAPRLIRRRETYEDMTALFPATLKKNWDE